MISEHSKNSDSPRSTRKLRQKEGVNCKDKLMLDEIEENIISEQQHPSYMLNSQRAAKFTSEEVYYLDKLSELKIHFSNELQMIYDGAFFGSSQTNMLIIKRITRTPFRHLGFVDRQAVENKYIDFKRN